MAHILIVDDDGDMADLLSMFLGTEGHDVRVATNGAEGLELAHRAHPDVIVLDVEMPVMTGPDMALALLMRDAGLEKIPVVLCSGVLNLPEVASRVGTPYFLPKPYHLDALDELVTTALLERRSPRPKAAATSAQ